MVTLGLFVLLIFSEISIEYISEYAEHLSTDSNKKQNEYTCDTFMNENRDTSNAFLNENFDVYNMPIQFIDGTYVSARKHYSGKFFSS